MMSDAARPPPAPAAPAARAGCSACLPGCSCRGPRPQWSRRTLAPASSYGFGAVMDATTVARTLAAGVGVGAALSCVLSSERELAVLLRTATAAVVLPRRTAPTTIAATEPATEPHWLRPLRASLPLTERVTYFQNGGHGPPPNGVLQAAADHAATAAHYCAPPPPPSGSPAFKAASLGSDGSAAVTADARLALGRLIGCGRPVESLALLSSTTQALQYVLGSLPWVPGDELIISNLEHVCVAAMCQGLEAERGVRIRCVCADRGDRFFTRELQASLSPHTRLVLLSHVSSCTGHVLPVAQAMALVAAAERYSAFEGGARTLIDGAQAVGQLEVDVDSLGCDYYVGSGHKWLCAPTGTAFVYAAPRVLPEFGPFPTAPVGAWPDHAAQPTTAAARAERGTADGSTHAGLREVRRPPLRPFWRRL
jgi:cysteine desulfurase/selenocysteine lyase